MYAIGDLVKVKDKDEIIKLHPFYWNNEMDQYCGSVFTVRNIHFKEYVLEGCYATDRNINPGIAEDCSYWLWHPQWLEPVPENQFDIQESDIMNVFK